MKLSANVILASIITCILLFMIAWVVQIQTTEEYLDITDKVVLKKSLESSIKRGKELFIKEDCYSCHKPNKRQEPYSLTLRNVSERRGKDWLFQFIRDEKSLIETKDPDVLALKEEFNWVSGKHDKKYLTDDQITDILNYLDGF